MNELSTAPPAALSFLVFLVLFIGISGCSNLPLVNKNTPEANENVQLYLIKARSTKGERQTDWLLMAAEALLTQQRTDKALTVLNTVNNIYLSAKSRQLFHLLLAQSLSIAKHNDQALTQFIAIDQAQLLPKSHQINYYRDYAELLDTFLNHYESALKRIFLSELLTDRLEIEENRELLWQSLIQLSNPSIYHNSLNGQLVNGWLELANLAIVYAEQPEVLLDKLEQWRILFVDHPANMQMPIDMARAETTRSYQPDTIALLLPESGSLAPSAKHIRDGFIAAIYQLSADKRPVVHIYDSSKGQDIQSLYQYAVDQGANFVIGPLRKKSVEELASLEFFPVPVLTINRLYNDIFLPQNFYQFGLPIEDEAMQVATKAWEDGLSRAMVLVPQGTIGERTTSAFRKQFEKLGGEIQQIITYGNGNDYSRAVQELLGVDKSLARYTRLKQLLGVQLHHEARRRQDSDFIFFKASVNQARRIKPFIDFYYAQDLPLYATSSIYSGKDEPALDRDLDNVLFSDIPWLISNDSKMTTTKRRLSALWPSSSHGRSARLFALGYDLYTLIPELSKLRNFPQYQKSGLSGLLTVNQQGHILRNLSWAKFVNGHVIQLIKK